MEKDKTQMYSDGDKTSLYGDHEKRTKESAHKIQTGDQVILNNKEYTIVELVSESTGEAVIYKAEDSQKKIIALKLYYEFRDPEQEPNTEALERIKNINDPDILNLIDYGTGSNKFKEKYCFEILDFAYGLDLLCVVDLKQKYTTSFMEKEVIPQIFKGILKLHENKIYHCDLKPQNVFYLDTEQKEIVVGDYGSSKTFDYGTEKNSRKTTTVKGTDFYLPPEQARGYISEKNDYYSFGMILLHIFYPEKILTDDSKNLSRLKLKQIIERQFESKPILDYNPEYKRINQIIEGLTLADFNLRWGKEEIQRWISGEAIPVIYKKELKPAEKSQKEQTLIFGQYTLTIADDLRNYILNEKNWYADLIEDESNKEDFIQWMINLNIENINIRKGFNNIIQYYSQDGIDYVSDALIRFLIPDHPLTLGVKSFDLPETDDILNLTVSAFSHLMYDLWEMSSEKEIKQFIFNFELTLIHAKNKTRSLYIRKHLNSAFKINEELLSDFENFIVHAYTKVNKDSADNIQNFISEIAADNFSITHTSLDKDNNLSYNLTKSSSEYLKNIGFDHVLPNTTEENQIIPLRCPQNSDSFDDFIAETLNNLSEDIIEKHYITNKINFDSIEKIAKSLKSTFNDLIQNIKSESTSLENDFSEKIKTIKGFSTNFIELRNFLQIIQYNKAGQTLYKIGVFKDEIKKVLEVKKTLRNCLDNVKEKSRVLPLLNEAEKLAKTDNFNEIDEAYQILTKKHSFETEKTAYLNEGEHKKVVLKKIIGSISYESDICCDSLTMSPKGDYFISSDNSEKFFRVFSTDIKGGEFNFKDIKNQKFDVYLTAVSPDGQKIACMGDGKQNIIIYEHASGEQILKLKEKDHAVENIAFSFDGKYLAAECDNDETALLFWNLESGKVEKRIDIIYSFCFHPFKNIVAFGTIDDEIAITDLSTNKQSILTESLDETIDALYFSPDGKLIASICDEKIQVWNTSDGKLVFDLKGHYDYYETNCCFSPDSKYFAAGIETNSIFSSDGTYLEESSGTCGVRFWSMVSGKAALTLNNLSDSCTGLAFHPSGEYLALTTADLQLFIISIRDLSEIKIEDFISIENMFFQKNQDEISYDEFEEYTIIKTDFDMCIMALSITHDGNYIVAATNNSVKIYDTKQNDFIITHKDMTRALNRIAISSDNKVLAFTDIFKEKAFVYDLFSGKKICSLKKKDYIAYGISFSHKGKYLAVSGYKTLFWNTETWKLEKKLEKNASVEVSFNPYKKLFASMGDGKTIITDYETWESKVISEEPSKGNTGICLSPGGEFLAISNSDNTIRIWDVKTTKLLHCINTKIPDSGKPNLSFSPDGKLLAHIIGPRKIRFWDTVTGKRVMTIKDFDDINGIAFHPSGEYIAVANEDQIVLIYLKDLIVTNS